MKSGYAVGGIVIAALAGLYLWVSQDAAVGTRMNADDPETVALGKKVYEQECASCHGANLQGQTPDWRRRLPDGSLPAPPHDETGHTWHHTDEMLFELTKKGRLAGSGGAMSSAMPGFGEKLDDAEIWAVLSYIKSEWPADIQARHEEMSARAREQQR